MTSSLEAQAEAPVRTGTPPCPILAVKEGLITIDISAAPRRKNEVGYILLGDRRLIAEILRIRGDTADMQVFEDTTGVKVGDPVEMSGQLLSAQLGPGLLGQVYDGLQNPLELLDNRQGFFLKRGQYLPAIDEAKRWRFVPTAKPGDRVQAGAWLGHVQERHYPHQILAPLAHVVGVVELRQHHHGDGQRLAQRVRGHMENARSGTGRQDVDGVVHAGNPQVGETAVRMADAVKMR